MKLTNLYNIITATIISSSIFSNSSLSKIIALKVFVEYKNLVSGSSDLVIGSHIITNNILTI